MTKTSRKIIFVTPWYGKDATGGAEMQCKTLAEHLKGAGSDVEIFTTCSRQFNSGWTNDLKPGRHNEEGISVHRFKVDGRDPKLFGYINDMIISGARLGEKE